MARTDEGKRQRLTPAGDFAEGALAGGKFSDDCSSATGSGMDCPKARRAFASPETSGIVAVVATGWPADETADRDGRAATRSR